MNDLEKTLSKAGITLAIKELFHTPSQVPLKVKWETPPSSPPMTLSGEVHPRLWRVILTRKIRSEEKPLRLTLTILSPTAPNWLSILKGIATDLGAAELSVWDFGQAFNNGVTNDLTESMRKACKRLVPRVRRFFGEDLWAKLERNGISKAA